MGKRTESSRKSKKALCLVSMLFLVRPVLVCAGTDEDSRHLATLETTSDTDDVSLQEPSLKLEAVLAYAQEHNPTIQAAQAHLRAAQERPVQVSALDDPMLTYEGFNIPENLDLTHTDNNILKLSQKLPFPGKRRLRGEIAEQETRIAKEEVRMAEATTRADVKKAYYNLWQVQQNLQIYSREKELMVQFAALAEKKYAVGQASQPDVLRAQVELTRLLTQVTAETFRLEEARALLNGLVSRPPDTPLGVPQTPPRPALSQTLSDLTELTLQNRPGIVAKVVAINRNSTSLALAQKGYFPDFEVVIERFFNDKRNDGVGVVLSTSLPFAYREKYDAGVAEARAQLQASKAELRAAEDKALAEVKSLLTRAQTAVALVNIFSQTHIPQTEQALASSRLSYQTGQIDFLALLESLRAVEQVQREHLNAAADFEKAYADLERAVGCVLPRS